MPSPCRGASLFAVCLVFAVVRTQQLRCGQWLRALVPGVLIHGTFDFVLLVSTWFSKAAVGLGFAAAVNVTMFVVTAVMWRRLWRATLASLVALPATAAPTSPSTDHPVANADAIVLMVDPALVQPWDTRPVVMDSGGGGGSGNSGTSDNSAKDAKSGGFDESR